MGELTTEDLAQFLEPGGRRNELIVLLHGFSGAGDRMEAVREVVRTAHPDADILAPALPFQRNRLCLVKPEGVVANIVSTIDNLAAERERLGHGYASIILIGHSFGAVLARRIAITAFGEQLGHDNDVVAPFEPELVVFRRPRAWARSVRRLVLLAGMNRGWSVSSAMDWVTATWWSLLQGGGEILLAGKPTIFAIRRGAPFLVQTRLQWLSLMDPDYGRRPDLIVVQLLGTVDDRVAPDDNVDYSVDLFGNAAQQSYFHLEVRQSGHANVIDMSPSGPAETASARQERCTTFLAALDASREQLAASCITREQMADNLPPAPNPGVTDVVFVVHGIRDKGFWTQKIARTIKRYSAAEQKFESWTESYGYFAMLPFVFRAVRKRKVEWLMDRYTEARARYPKATFHYVGHSNGTYLAAQALQDYPAARFKYVVFAGSVVRCDYDWLALMRSNGGPGAGARVDKVLNYVATRDWVVALFPKAMQPWRRFNLGSAGHDGFVQGSTAGPVYQVSYIVGGHSAGHEESHWDEIARFITSGRPPENSYPPLSRTKNLAWRMAGAASFILFPLLVAAILLLGLALLWSMFGSLPCDILPLGDGSRLCTEPTAHEAAWRAIALFGYVLMVYVLVTRF